MAHPPHQIEEKGQILSKIRPAEQQHKKTNRFGIPRLVMVLRTQFQIDEKLRARVSNVTMALESWNISTYSCQNQLVLRKCTQVNEQSTSKRTQVKKWLFKKAPRAMRAMRGKTLKVYHFNRTLGAQKASSKYCQTSTSKQGEL